MDSFFNLKKFNLLLQFTYHIYFKELTNHGLFASPCHLGGGFGYSVSEIGKPRLRETLLAKASWKCSQGWIRLVSLTLLPGKQTSFNEKQHKVMERAQILEAV